MLPLPIDEHLPALVSALRAARSLVLVAEPGAGKTTRLPRALLDAGFAAQGEVIVLEPRRIAARMAARRVAHELGEQLGERVGFQVRLEDVSSPRTRVRFVTEGVLTRKLVTDPSLTEAAVVVLDEFHERHLQGDLALALLRRLQASRRPDLRLVVMSATLDAGPVARFLGCDVLEVAGRRFEVALEYASKVVTEPLERQVAGALRKLLEQGLDGDVLAFLPGAAEIRRARDAVLPIAKAAELELAILHGDLPHEEQDRALAPSERRKVILSTNVAESSLTLEGVSAVIDCGLARVAVHSPWNGLPMLSTAKVSRASAAQRAGRAGRLRPGRCLRLYTKSDHDARPAHDKPEIARSDLADTVLAVSAIDPTLSASDFLDAPPAEAWRVALELCRSLSALDASGALTEVGRRVLRLPLHPRLGRVLLEAEARGAGERACTLVALLAERDILLGARAQFGPQRLDQEAGPSDALDRLDRFEHAQSVPGAIRELGLDATALRAVGRLRDRLRRTLPRGYVESRSDDVNVRLQSSLEGLPTATASEASLGAQRRGGSHDFASHEARETASERVLQYARTTGGRSPPEQTGDDEPLLLALLAGFGDRVAKRRAQSSAEFTLAGGGALTQSPQSVVREAELVVALAASERRGSGVLGHMLSAIEPEWLLELFPERVRDRAELRFDPQTERVEAVQALDYDGLALDESRAPAAGPKAEQVLYAAALERGIERFGDAEALERFQRRVAHAHRLAKEVPALPEDARAHALRAACRGKSSFADLRGDAVTAGLRALLPDSALAALDRYAPEHVVLAGGRRLSVNYEADRPPWVQSRLQDFFGLAQGPKLGGEPLVLHLLAPNHRAVQVTTDLSGFWQRHYPELRRQLMRHYPKHAWPEDPLRASPGGPGRAR